MRSNASGSVCPKGWTLPSGKSNGDFKKLTNRYYIENNEAGSTKLRSAPLSFVLSGYYRYGNGSVGSTGNGGYWSSATYSSMSAYSLFFSSSYVLSSDNSDRGHGYALRCVAR